MSMPFPTEAELRAQCKEGCLQALAHHKRILHLEPCLLTAEEIAAQQALYDAFYDSTKALYESK